MADDKIEKTGSVYYHIGNGGVTFSVERRPEGEHGNGPHLCVHGSSHGTKMTCVEIETTPDGIRALGLEMLEAANEEYPRASCMALGASDSLPRYVPWEWGHQNSFTNWNGQETRPTVLDRMRNGERVEKVEELRAKVEKIYREKAERLQKRAAVLRLEAAFAEAALAEHQRHTPKMWKRLEGEEWVDHGPRELARIWIACANIDRPDDVIRHLTTLFGLIESDEPWEISEGTWLGEGGCEPDESHEWRSFERTIREGAEEHGWTVETGTRRDARSKEGCFVRVSKGVGTIEVFQFG